MNRREIKCSDGKQLIRAELDRGVLSTEIEGEEKLDGLFLQTGPNSGIWQVSGKRYGVVAKEHDGKLWAAVNGKVWSFDLAGDDESGVGADAENLIAAPMPGKVIKVLASVGDTVEEGQAVLIVEAMKMEHTLRAPFSGKISELSCEEGEQVEANVLLMEIEAVE